MRIACLQFAPRVGEITENISRADEILRREDPAGLDVLVLPEMAFSGYNFKSLNQITPYLERSDDGPTAAWAREVARKYHCYVTVGYPEEVDISAQWPADPEYYNATATVDADGNVVSNYRKTFLYYTDETWALEGSGFGYKKLPRLGRVAMGICMDINPYKFEAPWSDFEFANHILRCNANLVLISMAWLTRELADAFLETPDEPDLETMSYWLARMEPLIRSDAEGEVIIVLANRCGTEDEAVYAGSSAILGIHHGEVNLYGILGRGEESLLVVDTSRPPKAQIVSERRQEE